jgi:hypothetical protein
MFAVPNTRELRQWDEAARKYEDLTRMIALMRQRATVARIIADFAASQGISVKQSDSTWWSRATQGLETLDGIRYRLGLAMDAAESGELAIQPTADGSDLDVVAPASLASKWEPYKLNAGSVPEYQQLGIAPIIVAGIAVVAIVAGIVTVSTIGDVYANKLERDLAIANRQAEIHFCADPNSATCLAWQARAKRADMKESQSAIDWLLGAGAGKKIGAGVAIAGVIALAVWALGKRGKQQ